MGDAPLAVVLGGDSILQPRSGVGRMALEIARAVEFHPDVAELRLLIGGCLTRMRDLPHGLASDGPATSGQVGVTTLRRRLVSVLGRVPGLDSGLRAMRASARMRRLDGQLAAMARERPDAVGPVYHEPNMIPAPFPGPTVITINDLSWRRHPEMHPPERIAWIGNNLPRALSQASRIVAISRFTADAAVRELGVARDRIDVVPLAAGPEFTPLGKDAARPVLHRHGLADKGYILSVSTLEPRKNFDRLLAAHLTLPAATRRRFPLAIAGGPGWGQVLAGRDADAARRDGTLLLLGRVSNPDLSALYARAAAAAYVSLYEGFGLPVLEAMAAGVPLIASSTTAVGELAGDAALLTDPLDQAGIACALRQVLGDHALASALRERGLARAAEYSWRRTADGLAASWRHAAGDAG